MLRPTSVLVGLFFAAVLIASPALAQFDTIFRDEPPRPPADIPPPPGQHGGYYPQSRQDYPRREYEYPAQRSYPSYPDRRDYPAREAYPDNNLGYPIPQRGPMESRDEPPAQPMPPAMSLPPSARPGRGTIESQPLAPPPGTAAPKQADRPITPQSPQPTPQPKPGAPTQNANKAPPGGQPNQPPANPSPPLTDEVVIQPPPQRITNPTAVFEGLDKITGRITSFDVAINETVQFGALQVTPKACYSRPPTETPQTDAFVAVDEVTLKGKIKRIFTGWMFAASPGLHAVEHPIYDVWLIDCKGGKLPAVAEKKANGE